MANICSNSLEVKCTKKHRDELKRFIAQASDADTIAKIDLSKMRKAHLEKNKQKYLKTHNLVDWVKHNTMRPANFFANVLGYLRKSDGSVYKGNPLSAEKLFPVPEELKKYCAPVRAQYGENARQFKARVKRCENKYGASNWYDWNYRFWGTKGIYESDIIKQTEQSITYYLNSAWSPPVEWMGNVSKLFPNLSFKMTYEESGECFRGEATAHNGEVEDFCERYTPTCHECEEEYDENGDCNCNRVEEEVVVETKKKTKKKNSRRNK